MRIKMGIGKIKKKLLERIIGKFKSIIYSSLYICSIEKSELLIYEMYIH